MASKKLMFVCGDAGNIVRLDNDGNPVGPIIVTGTASGYGDVFAVSPLGKYLALLGGNTNAQNIYDAKTGELLLNYGLTYGYAAGSAAFSRDDTALFHFGVTMRVLSTVDWSVLRTETNCQGVGDVTRASTDLVAFCRNSTIGYGVSIRTWPAWGEVTVLKAGTRIYRAVFSDDAALLALAFYDSPYIEVYQTSDWTSVGAFTGATVYNCSHLSFSHDNAYLVSCGSGGANIYRLADRTTMTLTGYSSSNFDAAVFNGDNTKVFFASDWNADQHTGMCVVGTWNVIDGPLTGVPDLNYICVSMVDLLKSIVGTVKDDAGTLCARRVTAIDRTTGICTGSVVSDGVTGAYEILSYNDNPHTVVAFDDAAGTAYNALLSDGDVPA